MRMRIDVHAKTLFPLLVGMSLVCIAYLQALGLSHLFAAKLNTGQESIPQRWNVHSPQSRDALPRDLHGDAILARNPFDSTVGPLDGQSDEPKGGDKAHENDANPYADPICQSGRVLLITTADEPSWSFAAMAIGREKAMLRRIGDGLGDQTVLAMVWDRVWLVKEGRRCQLPLGTVNKPVVAQSPQPPGVLDGIAEHIRHVADNRYEVERSILETVTKRYREFFRGVGFMPIRDSEGVSLKLSGIKPGSLLSTLGLMSGDKLQTINGFEMGDPMIAMQAYSRLLTADKLDVRLIRSGKPMSIDVTLR